MGQVNVRNVAKKSRDAVPFNLGFNPNKSGIGGNPPTFVQNDFTP